MIDVSPLVYGSVGLAVGWVALQLWTIGRREKDLPPGPPTAPLWGNLLMMPKEHNFLKFTTWGLEYGEIFSLKIAHHTSVVLSSPWAVYEVMEKHGSALADRPMKYVGHLIANGMMVGMAQYGPSWKGQRRAVSDVLRPASVEIHLPIQTAETHQLMFDILENPGDTFFHIQRSQLSVMLSIMFGARTPHTSSAMLQKIFSIAQRLHVLMDAGGTPPVELIPILKYIPERWAPWKREAADIRKTQRGLLLDLLDQCEERVKNGTGNDCYMEGIVQRAAEYGLSREGVTYTGASMLNAGSATTTAVIQFFVLIMTEYPEVQKRAREELDRVVGQDRLPTTQDIPNMPYIRAVIQECHRFRPVGPLALPHKAMTDLHYKGYRIPKGTSVYANIWAIYRDPEFFEDPYTFNPDRYIKSPIGLRKEAEEKYANNESVKQLNRLIFGTGRRFCPGVALGNNTVSLTAACMLWGFDFPAAWRVTDDGKVTDERSTSFDFRSGASHDPFTFHCEARVRSPNHARIIKTAFAQSGPVFARFEQELSREEKEATEARRSQVEI